MTVALEQYKEDQGEYPQSLTHLTPAYLPRIPDTGYAEHRQFRYRRAPDPGGNSDGPRGGFWQGNAPYALVVEVFPAGTLVYRPTLRYDDLPGARRVPGTDWGSTSVD